MARSSAQTQKLVILGLASAVAVGLLLWKISSSTKQKANQPTNRKKKDDDELDNDDDDTAPTQQTADRSLPTTATTTPTKKKASVTKSNDADATPKRTNKSLSNADMNTKIEELDRKGKAFFKDKQVCCDMHLLSP